MNKYRRTNPPWADIKRWAFKAGFVDDGFGEPRCTEWDDLRRFALFVANDAHRESMAEARRLAKKIVRRAEGKP